MSTRSTKDNINQQSWWRRLPIRTKLMISLTALGSLVLVMVAVTFVGNLTTTQSIDRAIDTRLRVADTAANAQVNLLRMLANVRGYLALGDSDFQAQYREARLDFETDLMALEAFSADLNPENQNRLIALQTAFEQWGTLPAALFLLRDDRLAREPAYRRLANDASKDAKIILDQANQLVESISQDTPSETNSELLEDLSKFQSSFLGMFAALRSYSTTQNRDFKVEYRGNSTVNRQTWERILAAKDKIPEKDRAKIDEIDSRREPFFETAEKIFEETESERWREDLYLFSTEAIPLANDMEALLDDLADSQKALLNQELTIGRRNLTQSSQSSFFIGLVVVAAGAFFGWTLWQAISGPLTRLTTVVKSGDLDNKAVVETNDEIGTLATAFNTMTTTLQDTISELHREKERAEEANRAKDLFLANMSHELRTPLNAILGYAQMLANQYKDIPAVLKHAQIIHRSGENLLELLNDVLDIAKIEAGKITLNPQQTNLPEYLDTVVDIIRPMADAKNIELVYRVKTTLPKNVLLDAQRLRQVLNNLLHNAVKFTDSGGAIVFTIDDCRQTGDQGDADSVNVRCLRVEVQDSGMGIPSGQLAEIFQPFKQGRQPVARDRGGTGLGLAISRELLGLMGSEIFVDSTPGVGSKFWFEIPLTVIASPSLPKPTLAVNEIKGYVGPQKTILVIDDIQANRDMMQMMLEMVKFQVLLAPDGRSGLEIARAQKIDLILLDWYMPVMRGAEVLQRLKQSPDTAAIPVVVVTAGILDMSDTENLMKEISAVLPKPVKLDDLLSIVERTLNLTWIYQQADPLLTEADLILPETDQLTILFNLAKRGEIPKIEAKLSALAIQNPAYEPFAGKMKALTKEFDDGKLMTLLAGYLGKEP